MAKFKLEIVTPERRFFDGEVEGISLDTLSGRIQILANHIAYASGLLPSVVKIKQDGQNKYAVVSGGFIQFMNNEAMVLADSAEWPEEIDVERAKEAYERAEARLKAKDDNIDKKRAKMALLRASARLKVAEVKGSKR
jgi:F-type H+-transporting ATPase subunit epsilon